MVPSWVDSVMKTLAVLLPVDPSRDLSDRPVVMD
jgi:hypothetical protein